MVTWSWKPGLGLGRRGESAVGYGAGRASALGSKSSEPGTSWQNFPRLRSGPDMPMPSPSSQRRVNPSIPLFTLDPLFPGAIHYRTHSSDSLLGLTPNAPTIDSQSFFLPCISRYRIHTLPIEALGANTRGQSAPASPPRWTHSLTSRTSPRPWTSTISAIN